MQVGSVGAVRRLVSGFNASQLGFLNLGSRPYRRDPVEVPVGCPLPLGRCGRLEGRLDSALVLEQLSDAPGCVEDVIHCLLLFETAALT